MDIFLAAGWLVVPMIFYYGAILIFGKSYQEARNDEVRKWKGINYKEKFLSYSRELKFAHIGFWFWVLLVVIFL